MANVFDYLQWRGDLYFKQSSPNEVDNIIFVFLTFLDFEGIVPHSPDEGSITFKDAVSMLDEKLTGVEPYYGAMMPNREIKQMTNLMLKCNRFSGIRLTGYTNEINEDNEEQFAAYTALLDDDSVFISFKGTDDSLVGWKEDLNMAFCDEVPCQRRAVEYLNNVGKLVNGKIRVGGHSKGGNLAVYAASRCLPEIQERIARVYNNDGPGFTPEFLESEGYLKVKSRVLKLVPQESVVGMLLGNDDSYTVVHSTKSGVLQHNSYLWEVRGKHFVRRPTLMKRSLELSRVLNKWIEDKDYETRKTLTQSIYEILTASDAKTITDFNRDRMLLWKSLVKIEPKKRDMVFRAMMELLGEIIKANVPVVPSKKKETEENKDEKTGD